MTPRRRITAHPGEILQEEFLAPLGMTANALATALRVPANRIGAILRGERAVTADTALRLARYFNTSAESGSTCRPCTTSPRPPRSSAARSSATCARGLPDKDRWLSIRPSG